MPWLVLVNPMASAKDIHVGPIAAADANACVRRLHYSGKIVQNSQLHLGVFLDGRLEGAMQFGPSLDKRKMVGLVRDTSWNGFIELNRMAFSDRLPRNSESRALGVAFRMMRRVYPHIQWVVSFADATQSGDGTIYRAAGFVLTGIKRNTSIWTAPSGERFSDHALRNVDGHTRHFAAPQRIVSRTTLTKAQYTAPTAGSASMRAYKAAGFCPLAGFQLRYVYFLDVDAERRLTVPQVPFERIAEVGAGMYRGQSRVKQATDGHPLSSDGAAPIHTLQPGGLSHAA
jgi:hypothetical protein